MYVTNQIYAIDHHHGQASRTTLSGYPSIRGATMADKADYYLQNLSWLHESLIREPRGHKNMLGSILTDPVNEESAFGVLFQHAFGLFPSCGDSTFATAFAALETGLVEPVEPVTRFTMDTVLGPLKIEADVSNGIVTEVRFENVPSYEVGSICIEAPEIGNIDLDVAFGGHYHGFVDADQLGISIDRSNETSLVDIAKKIWANGGSEIDLTDPENGNSIVLTLISFISKDSESNAYQVAHVYPPGRMGRTPGGTGTSALMGLLAARGQYDPTEKFVMIGNLGTKFSGVGTRVKLPNGTSAIIPKLGAKSYMMGIHHFVIDPLDPFGKGFILEG